MFGLGLGEGFLLLTIILLLFGGKRLPELGKSLGKSLISFKKGLKDEQEKKEQ